MLKRLVLIVLITLAAPTLASAFDGSEDINSVIIDDPALAEEIVINSIDPGDFDHPPLGTAPSCVWFVVFYFNNSGDFLYAIGYHYCDELHGELAVYSPHPHDTTSASSYRLQVVDLPVLDGEL